MFSNFGALAKAAASLIAAGVPDTNFPDHVKTVLDRGDIVDFDPEPPKVRTHHAWLHPTKGWRNFARPSGTNRRRRLIHQGALFVPGSREHNRLQPSGGRLPSGTAPAAPRKLRRS